MQAYQSHEDARKDATGASAGKPAKLDKAHAAALRRRAEPHGAEIDWLLVEQVVSESQGVAVPVSLSGLTFDGYVAEARMVDNRVPQGSNWDGRDDTTVSEPAADDQALPDAGTPKPGASKPIAPQSAASGSATRRPVTPEPAAATADDTDGR
jgi:hypothetical protein